MRTRSSRAGICGMCGSPMKKNGHDRLGSQRWMCTACDATRGVRHYRCRGRGGLDAFLAWLLGCFASMSFQQAHQYFSAVW
ncbi:IS1/IS1595 family N-terminal zinc-binding domain-containing protein, partial [Bifidobacterium pseudolongum]|uniref:IS1/IS1595 family N-terminal zinc-binding domain-containing protein n=1 Tax=Bifidobacterium pseudolongum TaxID=1694 RepID=UPI003CD0DA8A